jgi:hypothetical protein
MKDELRDAVSPPRYGPQAGRLTGDVCSKLQTTLASPLLPTLAKLSDRSDALSVHGVDVRYPDNWRAISKIELQDMLILTDEFAAILLPILKDYKND